MSTEYEAFTTYSVLFVFHDTGIFCLLSPLSPRIIRKKKKLNPYVQKNNTLPQAITLTHPIVENESPSDFRIILLLDSMIMYRS
jgi:hypothetical protein